MVAESARILVRILEPLLTLSGCGVSNLEIRKAFVSRVGGHGKKGCFVCIHSSFLSSISIRSTSECNC